jgi:hypothetical protein
MRANQAGRPPPQSGALHLYYGIGLKSVLDERLGSLPVRGYDVYTSMTQLTEHPASLLIEDQLDAIGQKHRLVRIVRGAMLWIAWGVIAAAAAALTADSVGQGGLAGCIGIMLLAWLAVSLAHWIVRPLLTTASPTAVARLVEQRITGLHNGLSNSVLLAKARDIAHNPWLGQIYEEVLAVCRERPLHEAVRFRELRPLGLRLGGGVAAVMLLVLLFPNRMAHGWEQMLTPARFVPKVADIQILSITPGDVTLVAGQPLEISIAAKGPAAAPPAARLIFDGNLAAAELAGSARAEDAAYAYSYRLDHVDQAMRYRVEVGGTQSNWYSVQIVPKVTLTALNLKITPPAYTRLPPRAVTLSPDEMNHAQLTVPQGSRVEIGAVIDVPIKKAVLMLNDQAPVEMTAAMANRSFYRSMTITTDAVAFVGLMGGDQIIARLPDNGLTIHATPDNPPTVTMRSPAQDQTIPPTQDLTVSAEVRDDYGVASARLLAGFGTDEPQVLAGSEQVFSGDPAVQLVQFPLKLTAEQAQHGGVVTLQVEATDNRDLTALSADLGPQSTRGPKIVLRFQDPKQIALDEAQQIDALSAKLREMIKLQETLHDKTAILISTPAMDRPAMTEIGAGQTDLRQRMRDAGRTDGTELSDRVRIVKKTLLVLAVNAATDAVELPAQIVAEPLAREQSLQGQTLAVKQQTILDTLQALLTRLNSAAELTTQPSGPAGSLPARVEAFKKLDDALKEYEKEQQRLLNQTAPLAKKPADDYDDQDKKKLDDLRMAQDKLDAFMQQAIADFSKNAQQDMSNPSLVKELTSIYTDVTMAKDALTEKSAETAVPEEEMGLESAEELKTNIEKLMDNKPASQSFTQEDALSQNEAPEAELPKDMQDIIGALMQQQEDLDQQLQQANANYQDSMDQAIGWQAKDGPISDNSAKGITSNVLPNPNDVQGRAGDGRTAQSSGEFVGDKASDKPGRDTPTRLDPTPFQPGQVQDSSKSPTGGSTGGGKISGEGAAGLEGPVPPKVQMQMKRLTQMQAELRNAAERLNLKYKVGNYDNFKLLQSIVDMRRVESDLQANRYQNALHHTDVVVDELSTSGILLDGRMHVEEDTTPASSRRTRKEIDDALDSDLPPVWSESLKEYYRKLSQQ